MLDFIYDESGKPFALVYTNGAADPVTYYYVLNLQGDVVGLLNSSGTLVANYSYNAWGEIISVTNATGTAITSSTHIANLNPLRYRGYYYDTETGFYYLQSRYYDPVTHRFINADSLASTGQGFVGTNMFAYCRNNSVNYYDHEGKDAIWIQEPDSAGGFGHSGLLVQGPDGEWYYFYWGPESEEISSEIVSGTSPIFILQRLNTEGLNMKTLKGVRTALSRAEGENGEFIKKREELIYEIEYLEGDFSDTYDFLVQKSSDPGQYSLLFRNCYQLSILALSESDMSFIKYYYVWPNAGYVFMNAGLGCDSLKERILSFMDNFI